MAYENFEKFLKLTDDNYFAWSIKIKALLNQRECFDAIDPGFGDEDLFETFTAGEKKKNARALSILLLSVSDKHIDYIGEYHTAKKAWDTLSTLNRDFSVMHQIEFLEDLATLKKSESMSMTDYVAKVLDLNRKIRHCGMEFGDHALSLFLLRGLPKEKFEIFIRSMEYQEKLELDSVIGKLMVEEKRQKRGNSDEMSEEAIAMAAFKKSQLPNHQKKHGTQNQESYREAAGSSSEPKSNKPFSSGPRVKKCFTCGDIGHISRECEAFKEFIAQKQKVEASAKVALCRSMEDVKIAKAYCSIGRRSTLKKKQWYLDSCSSDHMSPAKEDFLTLDENVTGLIQMGNGDVAELAGEGSVLIRTPMEDGGLAISLSRALYVPDLECALMSVSRLTDKDLSVSFFGNKATVVDGDELIFKAAKKDGVYVVNTSTEGRSAKSLEISKDRTVGTACLAISGLLTHQDGALKKTLDVVVSEQKGVVNDGNRPRIHATEKGKLSTMKAHADECSPKPKVKRKSRKKPKMRQNQGDPRDCTEHDAGTPSCADEIPDCRIEEAPSHFRKINSRKKIRK